MGYYFLTKAFEATGKHEEALEVITESVLSSEDQNTLKLKLSDSTSDPKKYWETLRF